MKQSEKILAGLTAGAVLLFAAWNFGGEQAISSALSGGTGVATQERRYRENLAALQDIYLIEREFRAVGQANAPATEGLRPDLAFTNEVEQLVMAAGFTLPRIRAEQIAIDGVEEYRLYTTAIQLETNFNDLVRLSKMIDQSGMIIREMRLVAQNDRDLINTTIVVGRIGPAPQARRPAIAGAANRI